MKRHWLFLLAIFLVSVFLLGALFHSGAYTAHDIWHNLARLTYYKQAISDGQFPPYWIGTLLNGWGYPLFFFSYHMPWLISLPFLELGMSPTDTLKLLFLTSYSLSGIFMYFFMFRLTKNRWASVLASFLYICAPYRFVITFVSAATGIAFAFLFLPILLLGIVLSGENEKYAITAVSVGLAGIILSHLTSLFVSIPVIFTIFLITFLRVPKKSKGQFLIKLALGIALGLAISSFYIVPALYYGRTVWGLSSLWERGFVSLRQLIYSRWDYGIINRSAETESPFSFQIGIAQWLSILLTVIFIFFIKIKKLVKAELLILLVGFALSVFLCLRYSSFIWTFLANLTNTDFPFRFIMPAFILGTICAGYIYHIFPNRLKPILFLALVLVGLYTNRNHLKVNMYINDVEPFVSAETTTNSYDEYLPRWSAKGAIGQKRTSIVDGGTINNLQQDTKRMSFDLVLPEEKQVSINYLSYPGLNTYLDDVKTAASRDEMGRIKILTPKGSHHIEVIFEGTPIIKLGKIMSLVGILILVFLAFKPKTFLPRLS